MTIATPLKLRWERAQQIDPAGIEDLGQGWYVVPSSRDPTGYAVHLEFDAAGKLTTASCTCPNFESRMDGVSAPTLHGLKVCKHVLVIGLKAKGLPPPALSPRDQENPAALKNDGPASDALPIAGEPAWDQECEEWVLTDAAGIHHCETSPSECTRQFEEARHYRAEHARKNGHGSAEPSAPQTQPAGATEDQPAQVEDQARPADDNRRQALSRARGIAAVIQAEPMPRLGAFPRPRHRQPG